MLSSGFIGNFSFNSVSSWRKMMVDRKRYDIAASEDNPLDYATARLDSDVLSYLRTALE